jgi:tRNA-dihydrouridine synthase B
LIFQVVGYTEEAIVEAASRLAAGPAAGIDINMGCSAPHIVRKGGGIAWMCDPDRAKRLVQRVREVTREKSLSVKVRLGPADDPTALVRFCRGLEQAGVDFVTLHPKSRKEGPSRVARWSYVLLLRERLTVPVVGNGGVVGHDALETRRNQSGNGPIMIGRAAARSPWIFAYLKARMNGCDDPWRVDLAQVSRRFFTLLEQYQPADFLPTRAARFASYLTGNLAYGHSLGARLAQCRSYARIKSELLCYFDEHPDAAVYEERR